MLKRFLKWLLPTPNQNDFLEQYAEDKYECWSAIKNGKMDEASKLVDEFSNRYPEDQYLLDVADLRQVINNHKYGSRS